MGTTKFILMVMAVCVKATPVSSALTAETTKWKVLPVQDMIDWNDVDMDVYNDHSNWDITKDDNVTIRPAKLHFKILKGACDQGTCPDYKALFVLVYIFSAVEVLAPPPTTLHGGSDIRVNDCGQCHHREAGNSLGVLVPGGCWDFTSCNQAQIICVDPAELRAHRIWKDNGDKKCYGMNVEHFGSCGPVKKRVVLRHNTDLPCN